MSERLADVGRSIVTVRQLGAVVNAMRGMAGARAQQARALLPAIRAYAETAERAIGQARRLGEAGMSQDSKAGAKPALVLFGAEQGFAGAFAEQVLDAAADDTADGYVFLLGSRTATLAAERGLSPGWTTSLPSRAAALPYTVAAIVDALYDYLASEDGATVAMVYPAWRQGGGVQMIRRSLLPFDPHGSPARKSGDPPIINLPVAELIARLGQEYLFALLCEAAAEAFAAENEARMTAMAAAKTHIDGELAALQAEERLIRQEEITAEVVELSAAPRSLTR